MPFSDVKTTSKKSESTIRKMEFMSTPEGNHRVRILDQDYVKFYTHYFAYSKVTVMCLGDDCPVCHNNKNLIMQFPEDFRSQQGYNRRTARYFVNVLDKTPSKVCVCGKEYKGSQHTFCTCGERLPLEQTPLNKVKVLAKGESLFADLAAIEGAILDEKGEKVGLTNYDITIVVRGSGRDTSYTAVADPTSREPVNVNQETLFDLSNAVIKLSEDEMLDVQRGVSLKDIFSARKAKNTKHERVASEQTVDETTLEDVRESIDKLFQQ